ncbi:DUF3324 domain-containing protein [Conexibacter sp. DBS9H8]|uniref:DUF3324 domain-containing protein n=1 Tax=Conexibacter sp. DBS9H8 TaxID=2937801 RepID=UPI00200C75E0|nr:DUF3324 domain-containing protein [Conexibacter sp. DBS9H8]
MSYRDSLAATSTLRLLRWTPLTHCTPRRTLPGHGTIGGCRRIGWHLVTVGSFTHQDYAGINRFRFSGRVNGHPLKPGRYTLQVTAALFGRQSREISAQFTILSPPR